MAYDEHLANRVREALADQTDVTEKRMFGGLAFLIAGNMALTVSHRGGLMVRTDPEGARELIANTKARQIEMRGRPMPGWLHVGETDIQATKQLKKWVGIATAHTRSLQPKNAKGAQSLSGS